jgi:hypothetical protein
MRSTQWVCNRSTRSSGPERRIGPPWKVAGAKYAPTVDLLLDHRLCCILPTDNLGLELLDLYNVD